MRYMEIAALDDIPTAINCGLYDRKRWSNAEGNRLRVDIAWRLKAGKRGTPARSAIVIDGSEIQAEDAVLPNYA